MPVDHAGAARATPACGQASYRIMEEYRIYQLRVACNIIIGINGLCILRLNVIWKPVSATVRAVSRFQWQLPESSFVSGTTASCIHAVKVCSERTCSTSSSVPPGFKTRITSWKLRFGSEPEQKTSVATTLSNDALSKGRDSTAARVSVIGTCAVFRRSRA